MPTAADLGMTADELNLLRSALREWGGPAHLTDPVARAIGFADVDGFVVQCERINDSLNHGAPMSMTDWRRTLLATEVVFVSDVLGSGTDWETTTNICDADALRLLRSLQRKLVH